MQKIIKKFIKEYFEVKDNVIDKNLIDFIERQKFSNRTDL